ncbi:MAG: hypothetical protein ACLPND_04170 [Candidatus Korobacteraceae bacterium]
MENKKLLNQFEEVHKRVKEARDHAREVQEMDSLIRQERAEKEAGREGFDRPSLQLPPRLIADGSLQRCSVCGYPFPADVHPSMSVAFADHLSKAHKPGQTTEVESTGRGIRLPQS